MVVLCVGLLYAVLTVVVLSELRVQQLYAAASLQLWSVEVKKLMPWEREKGRGRLVSGSAGFRRASGCVPSGCEN